MGCSKVLFFKVILCIILLIVTLLYIPFYFDVEYVKNAIENRTRVKLKILWITIVLVPKKKPKHAKKAEKEETASEKPNVKELLKNMDFNLGTFGKIKADIADILKFLSRKAVKVKNLEFGLNFGFDDAPTTGITTGVFNALAYNGLAFLHNNITINKWKIDISPDFNKERFDIGIKCIVRIKSAHIIIALIKLLKIFFKIKKMK